MSVNVGISVRRIGWCATERSTRAMAESNARKQGGAFGGAAEPPVSRGLRRAGTRQREGGNIMIMSTV